MGDIQWFQIVWAVILGFMVWRLIPVAKNWMENGPRGSGAEWLNAALLLAGVGLFVVFLISIVRS